MMNVRFLFILVSLVSTNAYIYAQQYSVSGCVADTSGQTLPDANVLFFVRDSLVAGTTTNSQGCFSLNINAGEYSLTVNKFGYGEKISVMQ
jgi:hypothetical protein